MMNRLEATRVVTELAGDAPIIGGVGSTGFDLAAFDRAANFYMWNSMGMASSIALGLCIARPDLRVVCLDGDGSLLMNLGSIATAAMAGIKNLVHVVWDNGGWDITGGQPAGTSFGIDLAQIARGSGFTMTATAGELEPFRSVLLRAMNDTQAWFIVGTIEAGGSKFRPSKNLTYIRDRMVDSVRAIGRPALTGR